MVKSSTGALKIGAGPGVEPALAAVEVPSGPFAGVGYVCGGAGLAFGGVSFSTLFQFSDATQGA